MITGTNFLTKGNASMNIKIALVVFTSLFTMNAFAEITTFNTWRAKKDAKQEDVVSAVKALNAATRGADGLISKKTYYNSDAKSFVDIIVWRDQAAADKVSKEQSERPEFAKLAEIIDVESIHSTEYKAVD
jgi:quinol monooxygenase YgiN